MSLTPCHKTSIANNLEQIQRNIVTFCQKYQRKPSSVKLLAVSKTKPAADISCAFNAAQTCFGENYLQEAVEKIQQLERHAIEWHFIGAIQSNKTRELAEKFSWIHSIDRLKIAQRLSQQRPVHLSPLNICLQVNISQETSKSGFHLTDIASIADKVIALPNINLRGLMAIPAKADTLEQQREIFAQMKHAFIALQQKHSQIDTLSMGMSNDMEAAIAEGSTLLRIGSAIFGTRNPSAL